MPKLLLGRQNKISTSSDNFCEIKVNIFLKEEKNKWAASLMSKNPRVSADLGWILKIAVFIDKKSEKQSFMIKNA